MKYSLANNGGESIGTVSLASSSTMTLSGPISAVSFGGVLELDAGATLLLPPQLSAELTFTFALTLNAGATLSLPTATSVSFGGSVSLGAGASLAIPATTLSFQPNQFSSGVQLAEGATLTLGGGVRLVQGLGWLISLAFTSPGTVVVGQRAALEHERRAPRDIASIRNARPARADAAAPHGDLRKAGLRNSP